MFKAEMKRGMALLLTASMLMGLSLSAVDNIRAYADANVDAESKPSLSAYASKYELQSEFNPGSEDASIGKLKLGKYNNDDIEWYILGSDSGVVDSEGKAIENTAIFAASNITGTVAFQADYKWDDEHLAYVNNSDRTISDAKVSYNDEITAPISFWANHYGLSDVRNMLREMAGDSSSIFSSAELNLMNETNVMTDDVYNKNAGTPRYYTTSDKLYLPYGNKKGAQEITIGSDDSKALSRSKYWGIGDDFWLRAPYSSRYGLYESCADPSWGLNVDCDIRRSDNYGVRPASNLNLSSVLFASAATVASSDTVAGSITAGTAMKLRLDGTDKNIGSVKLSGDTIQATSGDSGKTVSLVVQGMTGGTDWYYSEVISADDTVKTTKDTIQKKLDSTILGDINLSSCKIWLEIKDSDDGMLYAVTVPEHKHTYDDTWTYADSTNHYHECTDSECPDKDGSRTPSNATHMYGDDNDKASWSYNRSEHYKKCTVCELEASIDESTKKEHVLDRDGKCTTCLYDENKDYNFTYVPEAKATCEEDGHEEYWYCNDEQNDIYQHLTELGIRVDCTEDEIEIYKAEGHVPSSSYDKDATNHWQVCTNCNKKLNVGSHIFENNKCTVCGYTKSSSSSGGSSSSGSSNVSNNWIKDSRGWKYRNSYGTLAQGSTVTDANGNKVEKILWQKVGNSYYAIGSDGYLKTEWVYDGLENKWYYCDENIGRLSGWFYSDTDGYWYYLSPSTGEMLTGWQSINGREYYFAGTPSAPTYSFDASTGFWIYSNLNVNRPFGSMYANTVTPDNYTVDASGAWVR